MSATQCHKPKCQRSFDRTKGSRSPTICPCDTMRPSPAQSQKPPETLTSRLLRRCQIEVSNATSPTCECEGLDIWTGTLPSSRMWHTHKPDSPDRDTAPMNTGSTNGTGTGKPESFTARMWHTVKQYSIATGCPDLEQRDSGSSSESGDSYTGEGREPDHHQGFHT